MRLRFPYFGLNICLLSAAIAGTGLAQPETAPHLVLQTGHAFGSSVEVVTFSPDGKTLASAGDDGTVKLVDVATGAVKASFEAGWGGTYALAYSPDGKEIATGGIDGPVEIWSREGERLRDLPAPNSVSHGCLELRYTAKGQLVGMWNGLSNCVWNPATGAPPRTFAAPPGISGEFEITPDGTRLIAGTINGTVGVFDLTTGRKTAGFKGSTGQIGAVAVSPDGKTVAVGGANGFIKMFDLATGNFRGKPMHATGGVRSLAFSHDGKTLGCLVKLGALSFWNASNGTNLHSEKGALGNQVATAFALSPDGRTVGTGEYEGGVNLIDAGKWTSKHRLEPAQSPHAATVIASPDGHWIAVGGQTGEPDGMGETEESAGLIQIWDTRTGRLNRVLRGPERLVDKLAFSADGRRLAAYSAMELYLWSVPDGRLIWKTSDFRAPQNNATMSVTPDTIVFADPSGPKIRRWSLATGKELGGLALKTGHINPDAEKQFEAGLVSPIGQPLGFEKNIAMCVAGDGSIQVVSESSDKQQWTAFLRAFDGKTGQLLRTTELKKVLFSSPLGKDMIEVGQSPLRVFHIFQVSPRPGTNLVAVGIMDELQFRDAASGELVQSLRGTNPDVDADSFMQFVFSPDGKTLISGSETIWDIAAGTSQPFAPAGAVLLRYFSMTYLHPAAGPERFIALNFESGAVKFFDPATGAPTLTLVDLGPAANGKGGDRWLSVTADGHYSGSEGIEKMFRWRVGDQLFTGEKFATQMRLKP